MIEIENLTKSFDETCAVNHISLTIPDGVLYGLLGTNGAGKTTLLKMLAGILKPDEGEIRIDGEPIYENPKCKENVFYLSDTPYYFPNADMEEMIRFFGSQYPDMDAEGVRYLAETLNLDTRRPLRTFSKGMKRQAFLLMALCANTKYLLCDEVFDGLDPIVTKVMEKLIHQEMKERDLTVVVVSHKLRDLEDICRYIGILHKGGLVTSGNMVKRAKDIHKFQCIFREDSCDEQMLKKRGLDIVRYRKESYFTTLIVRDVTDISSKEEQTENTGETEKNAGQILQEFHPVFCEEVPMTLEEIFVAEMEVTGYDIRKVLQ